VRVVDANGVAIPGAVIDLGGGASKLIAGEAALADVPGTLIRYRDWSCGRIELPAAQVGKPVTVQFITDDCQPGAHFAYAYLDDFCGGGNCGPSFALVDGPRCGRGNLCFRATPDPVIQLTILQTGAVLTNPQKNGDQFCFAIDPTTDFDFTATAVFLDGSIRTIGTAPGGIDPGIVDYRVSCDTPSCSLVVNGDFEAGNRDFGSGFTFAPASVRPGEYAVLDADEARAIAATWIACPANGKFLVVNGTTCRSGPRTIWTQQVPVQPNASYRFTLRARNLPQRAFDVKPRIEVRFPGVSEPALYTISTSGEPCDRMTIERDLRIPSDRTALTIEIRLLDEEAGDGNDLALDGISLCRSGG
jgi:hypothetical protein